MAIHTTYHKSLYITGKRYYLSILIWFVMIGACTEPYIGPLGDYEDVLVVSGIITNEYKPQTIELSRSYSFEEEGPQAERNAQVRVTTNTGEEYFFREGTPGTYISQVPFAAEISKQYTLHINTSSGKSYASSPMDLPVESTSIDKVRAERIINDEGVEGMAIYVDSYDPANESHYYRFDFDETYKIIAPYWSPYDAVFVIEGVSTYDIPVILREQEERICYGTNSSKSILLKSTAGLIEDRIKNHLVRFINRRDYMLSYRYSILVKQYVQSPETFSYYEALRGLSGASDQVFSEDQPGFLAGNIYSDQDANEHVVGFFEVSAVAEKRIFFSYGDYFPNEDLPPFITGCEPFAPSSAGTLGTRELVNLIREGSVRFYDFNRTPSDPNEGEYLVVRPECGDCTVLGSNKVPDFWIE